MPSGVLAGVVHAEEHFAVRCTSLRRCAVVYAGGLHVVVWRGDAGRLAALVEVPQAFFNRTVGLLGLWSSSKGDDFLMSNGAVMPSPDGNPPVESKLHEFGMSCECMQQTCAHTSSHVCAHTKKCT